MGDQTKISWTEATWNPVTGCTPISEGCRNCYAKRTAERLQNMGVRKYRNGFDVTLHPDVLDQPSRWRKPRMVFVCSMSDLFHSKVPPLFIRKVFDAMLAAPQHTYQVLTKRVARAAFTFAQYPDLYADNIWVGCTVENMQSAWRPRCLATITAPIRFVSFEPLLGSVADIDLCGIHWVICGGESGPNHRPMNLDWARELRDKCVALRIPFFFKQRSGPRPGMKPELDGEIWHQYPEGAQDG